MYIPYFLKNAKNEIFLNFNQKEIFNKNLPKNSYEFLSLAEEGTCVHRWGDAPLKTLALSTFVKPEKMLHLNYFKYVHGRDLQYKMDLPFDVSRNHLSTNIYNALKMDWKNVLEYGDTLGIFFLFFFFFYSF